MVLRSSFRFIPLVLLVWTVRVDGDCRYRNREALPEGIFSLFADSGCYKYTQKKFFIDNGLSKNITSCSINGNAVPGIIVDSRCQVFHHNNSLIQDLVQKSFVSDTYFLRWLQCCEDALQCCRETSGENAEGNLGQCPAVWDGWTCYSSVAAGTVVEKPCPTYAYSGSGPQCTHYSRKECFSDGTWNVNTNYSTCAINQRLITRLKWHLAMLGISLAFSLPALVIFFAYKSLQSLKFILIRNLILAIVIRSILVIMSKRLIIFDALVNEEDTVISKNGVSCRILAFFEKLAANTVFTCMLLEAIHLHSLLTNIFEHRRSFNTINMKFFYISGGAISLLAALSWALAMALANDQYCWMVTDGTDFQWINDAPRLLMLAINFVLLIHIIRCLRKMLRENPNESNYYIQRLAKISLICLPLFGVPFLFVAIRPDTQSCIWEQFYYFVSYALEGLQGIFVALLHCYTNKEVQCTLRESWWKFLGATGRTRHSAATWSIPAESRPLSSRSALRTSTIHGEPSAPPP
ncbi:corticotropin-releasing factor receptor 2-like isoform X2 [Phlebotomus argentipes]|uniref:corticotropin-releasing factor receptor 2-like isoform X2 n=1 Tax=Phlebotomus argentipes TaxID=94469 RepID=UPI0028934262|nr:corticotropin-releasing factor receptor 2-like isoform X2 [Phlebotomus argentipes]